MFPLNSATSSQHLAQLTDESFTGAKPVSQVNPSFYLAFQKINPQHLLNTKLKNPSLKLTNEESMTLLSWCIQLGEIESQNASGKEVVAVIGNTQAGKSTLINYLFGCEMEAKNAKELGFPSLPGKVVQVKDNSLVPEAMKIGHSKLSTTFIPTIVTDQKGLSYCDCPGFIDNRGFEINLSNAVNIRSVLINAEKVKIVILINFHSLNTDRDRGLSEIVNICKCLFGSEDNFHTWEKSILLGITHIPPLLPGEDPSPLEDLQTWIRDSDRKDSFEKEILSVLSNRLFLFDPLNRSNLCYHGIWNRNDILHAISNMPFIEHQTKIMKTVLSAEDERSLRMIAAEIQVKIEQILKRPILFMVDYQSIKDQYQILFRLKIIDHPFILQMLELINSLIIAHINLRVRRFYEYCNERSSMSLGEAKTVLNELENGFSNFPRSISDYLDLPSLKNFYSLLQEKMEAEVTVENLQHLEREFRQYCDSWNFVAAEGLLVRIREKLVTFESRFKQSHGINLLELNSLFNQTKDRYDLSKKKKELFQEQMFVLEGKSKDLQIVIKENNKIEIKLSKKEEKERRFAQQAQQALENQNRVSEAQTKKIQELSLDLKKKKKATFEANKKVLENQTKLQEQEERIESLENEMKRQEQTKTDFAKQAGALSFGCKSKNLEFVQKIISYGGKPDPKTLTWAFLSKNVDIINCVLKEGAQPDNETLNAACSTNQIAMVKLAIKSGAKPNWRTFEVASGQKDLEILNIIKNEIIKIAQARRHLHS